MQSSLQSASSNVRIPYQAQFQAPVLWNTSYSAGGYRVANSVIVRRPCIRAPLSNYPTDMDSSGTGHRLPITQHELRKGIEGPILLV